MKSLSASFQIFDLGGFRETVCTSQMFRFEAVFSPCDEYWRAVRSDWRLAGPRVSVSSTGSEGGRGSVMNTDTSQLQTFGAGGHTLTADRHTLKHTYNLVTLQELENKEKVVSKLPEDNAFC